MMRRLIRWSPLALAPVLYHMFGMGMIESGITVLIMMFITGRLLKRIPRSHTHRDHIRRMGGAQQLRRRTYRDIEREQLND